MLAEYVVIDQPHNLPNAERTANCLQVKNRYDELERAFENAKA